MEEMKYLQGITMATEVDKKVAFANVKIGEITVRGITVWRSGNGHLRVFFPRYTRGLFWEDIVSVPPEIRSAIETEVIAAYREEKKEERKIAAKIKAE